MESNTFVEWLRLVTHTANPPKPYKGGSTLVSVKMCSPYSNTFFFQHLLMNYAHRSCNELHHPKHDQLPNNVEFFTSAINLLPSIWNDDTAIYEYFQHQGNREFYVATLGYYISSLRDILRLWEKKVLTLEAFLGPLGAVDEELFELNNLQNSIYEFAMHSLTARDEFYNDMHTAYEEDCSDDEEEQKQHDTYHVDYRAPCEQFSSTYPDNCNWRKFILITEQPGSGNSQIVKRVIQQCLHEERNMLVGCPTGLLASDYNDTFASQITSDTIHSAFQFPVNKHQWPTINWNISKFDVLIIDELSMKPQKIVHSTLLQHCNSCQFDIYY